VAWLELARVAGMPSRRRRPRPSPTGAKYLLKRGYRWPGAGSSARAQPTCRPRGARDELQ